MTYLSTAFAIGLGVLTWTFLEYCIHRWLGHDRRTRPNPFATEHVRHHSQGDYFAPTWKKGLAAVGAMAVVAPPAVLLAGPRLGLGYSAGLVGFYLVYEILHRLDHTYDGIGPWGRWSRRHHFWHHFGNAEANHGVTTPIWDFVFGTYEAPGLIVVPERLAMTWLADPDTGDVRPQYADHSRYVDRRCGPRRCRPRRDPHGHRRVAALGSACPCL